jgi:hypothetical protein
VTPQPIIDTDQHISNPPLPVKPRAKCGPQLIVKGKQVVEVRTPSGHPPACVVRAGDWS